jgi:DNA-binding response OmpR family regulator
MSAMTADLTQCERSLVVVIEDEPDVLALVIYTLRAAGFDALGAGTAGEGLAIAALHRPAVVVIDRMLGDADGIDICTHLRADEQLADAALLVLSARGSFQDRQSGLAAGADDYLVKPFPLDALVDRVRRLVALAAARRALRPAATL